MINSDFSVSLEPPRIEYDAYRVDLEELNMGPRDATTVPKLEQAQRVFQGQRERYQKVRDDLSIKVKLLEENRVRDPRGSRSGNVQLLSGAEPTGGVSAGQSPPAAAVPAARSRRRSLLLLPHLPAAEPAAGGRQAGELQRGGPILAGGELTPRQNIWTGPGGGGCCVGNETEEGGVSL